MAHFARLTDDNIVELVVVISNEDILDNGVESEALGVDVARRVVGPGRYLQTSYNGNMRRRFAGIGFTYDEAHDAFVGPSPFPSWVLDEATLDWVAPVPTPDDATMLWAWDEQAQQWVGAPVDEIVT